MHLCPLNISQFNKQKMINTKICMRELIILNKFIVILQAKSRSSILPPLRSTECRTFDKKIDPVETLPRMIDKLSINESAKRNITSTLNQNSTPPKEIKERDSKLTTVPLYNIDGMSSEELQASLCRITKTPREPFSFLATISDKFVSDKQLSTKPTEIDVSIK